MANRVTQVAVEVLVTATPSARVTQVAVEALVVANPQARVTQIAVEVLQSNTNLGPTDMLGLQNSMLGNFMLGIGAGGTIAPIIANASNTLSMSQSATTEKTLNVSASNTLTLSQTAGLVRDVSASNTLSLSQDIDVEYRPNTFVTSTLTLSQLAEAVVYRAGIASNTLNLSQAASATQQLNRSASNTLTLTDQALRVIPVEASDVLDLDHEAIGLKRRAVFGTNALTLVQVLARELTLNRSMNQPVVLVQSATKQMSFFREVTNTLTLSQTATCTVSKLATNELTLSHTADFLYLKGARNAIELTQSVAREVTYNKHLFSNLIPFQVLSRVMTYRRSVENELELAQEATCQVVKAVSNTLNLTQEATAYVARPAFDTLILLDLASENHTSNVLAEDQLFIGQSVEVQKSKAVQAQSILGFNQFARGTKVLNASASNVLTLTQALVGDYVDESAENVLVLSQSATGTRLINVSASNTLGLQQALALSKTIVRSVSNELVFLQSFEKRTGIVGFPVVTIPSAQATVTKKKCVMILEYAGQSITLPCPEFNDSEGSVIRLNVKRSMNGTRRVYKRDNPTSTLSYDLVMDRLKAIELRAFILANNSNPLRLTNFKGELWLVLLTNSPFSFSEDAYRDSTYGNRSSISLQFEGVRLN